jgi:UDP:flavonoid glycosyltransferase YjiC (YdhE family)
VRVLFASTRGAGHFNPLVPFLDAARRLGHEVLVAGPTGLRPVVARTDYPFHECSDPAEEDIRPVWERVQSVSPEEANVLVVREIFARFDAAALLPGLRDAIEAFGPDLVVRETSEYGSAVAADLAGIPHARVGIGLATFEESSLAIAARAVSELRTSAGLEADPDGERMRSAPYLTFFPASLEAPGEPEPPRIHRFRHAVQPAPKPLPDWWEGEDEPLVYVTFGSIAGALPHAATVYATALEALDGLPVRALLTLGAADAGTVGRVPANVHIETWVPQHDVLAHAAAVVCHGGSGSTIGALEAGRPLVVVPLFADQPGNAKRVEAVGAGVSVAATAGAIRGGIETVLGDPSFRAAATSLAEEMRSQTPVDEAYALLATAR